VRLLNRRLRREQCRLHRLLLAGRTPIDQAGATPTFSLLFDMNKVFERFVAAILRRYVAPGLPAVAILPQAGPDKRHRFFLRQRA
jgi:hypothetical protein